MRTLSDAPVRRAARAGPPPSPGDLRRQVAGLVWGTVSGATLTPEDRQLLRAGLGGVVLFGRNVESPAQLRRLTSSIRAAAGAPVVISIDQEGGHIVRVGEPLTRLPAPMAIGATGDARLAREVALASARELAACGVDVVLAPVLDVAVAARSAVVGPRSFGADPALVARLGAATIRGYLAGGVLPVAKHFPGHGRTPVDSHLALPVVEDEAGALDATDLVPFRAAVAAGVPALMTAHVVHSGLDATAPASLSGATTRLARERLGFGGLLVTDAIVMDAVARSRPLESAAADALRAGADVVMVLEPSARVIDHLAHRAAEGSLPATLLATATRRAGAFAAEAAAARATWPDDDRAIGAAAHERLAADVARRSLTLVAGNATRSLAAGPTVVIDVASTRPSPVEDTTGSGTATGAVLAERLGARLVGVDPRESGARDGALTATRGASTVIVLTRDAFADDAAREVLGAVAGARTTHVALRNPVDLELAPCGVQIAAYNESAAVGSALAAALRMGPDAFPGRLPVAVRCQAIGPATRR